ncbi:hypothetical protein [Caulobacter sp. 1776]|uniref:hypothetical protein n=1 Tax=Caulobacter sp. 1776 TaxID=3156420 RepID=UPI0033974844
MDGGFHYLLLTRETGEGDREAVEGASPGHPSRRALRPPPSRGFAARYLPRGRGRRTQA